jgi:hypothetical protein
MIDFNKVTRDDVLEMSREQRKYFLKWRGQWLVRERENDKSSSSSTGVTLMWRYSASQDDDDDGILSIFLALVRPGMMMGWAGHY